MGLETILRQVIIEQIKDFHCLADFYTGIEAMDTFIHGSFRLSVQNHYCSAYSVKHDNEVIAMFALSFDSLDLDVDDKESLSATTTKPEKPNIDWDYQETFYSKPRYPALDIAYLAVKKEWQHQHIGKFLINQIAERARTQNFAGCQFLTVESLSTRDYSAVGFYERCGFMPSEVKKPYKDTLRMFLTLYSID